MAARIIAATAGIIGYDMSKTPNQFPQGAGRQQRNHVSASSPKSVDRNLVFTLTPSDFARHGASSLRGFRTDAELATIDDVKSLIKSGFLIQIAEDIGTEAADKLSAIIDIKFENDYIREAGNIYIDIAETICHNIGRHIAIHDFDYIEYGDHIAPDRPRDATEAAFNDKAAPKLSLPRDGKPVPYPGKRAAGDVRKFLISSYPEREGADRLTLTWLKRNDPRAYRALYTQSADEPDAPSDFLPSLTTDGDELLQKYGIDMSTDDGLISARKLYSILSSRLNPRRR